MFERSEERETPLLRATFHTGTIWGPSISSINGSDMKAADIVTSRKIFAGES